MRSRRREPGLEHKRTRHIVGVACLLALAGALVASSTPAAELIPAPSRVQSEPPIERPVGMARLVRYDEPVKSIYLADPTVADLKVVADDLIYIYGKKVGTTNLIALDSDQKLKSSAEIRVYVDATPVNEVQQVVHPGSKAAVAIVGTTPVIAGTHRNIGRSEEHT